MNSVGLSVMWIVAVLIAVFLIYISNGRKW